MMTASFLQLWGGIHYATFGFINLAFVTSTGTSPDEQPS